MHNGPSASIFVSETVGSDRSVSTILTENQVLGGTSKTQRKRDHSQLVEKQLQNPFYFAAPGGESIANACLRVEQFLQELRENCAGQRVVVVCHGNIIEGFKVRLEGMTGFQYRQWLEDRKDEVRLCVHNCQVVHYSRRNPYTGHIHGRFRWCRSVCPWDPSLSYGTWTPVVEPKFSNEDMLKEVNKVKQLVNNKLAEELQRTTQASTLQRSTSKCGKADTPGVIPPLTKSSSKAKATVIAVDPAPQRKEKEGALTPRILSMPDGAMSPRTTRASDTRASDGPDAKRAKFGHV
mmetsp:Transcript_48448/g.113781  ORF Transcript_48448/g.113781 Transcript_48448/m.113781 type:complete len:293 (+) Transcript_48448:296-1174(+)